MNVKPLVKLRTYLRLFKDGLLFSFPLAVVFLVIALVWGRSAADDLFSGEIFRNVTLNYPVYADLDSQNNLYVIDNASRRIVSLSTDGQERWQVSGGKRSGGFYETYRLAAIPDGGVLAYNYIRNPDDSLQAEEIVKFTSGGSFAGVLVHVDYDQSKALSDDQHIGSLKVKDGFLYYSYQTNGKLLILKRDLDPSGKSTAVADHETVFTTVAALDLVTNAIHLPQGIIGADRAGGLHLLGSQDAISTPPFAGPAIRKTWDIKTGPGGEIYLLDNLQTAVYRADTLDSLQLETLFTEETVLKKGRNTPSIEAIAVGPSGTLAIVDKFNNLVFLLSPDKSLQVMSGGNKNGFELAITLAFLTADFLALLLATWSVVGLIRRMFAKKTSLIITQFLMYLPVVILSVSVGSVAVYGVWDQNLQKELRSKLKLTAELGARLIDGSLVARIQSASDWQSPAHVALGLQYDQVLSSNANAWDKDLRAVVYKYENNRFYFVKNSSSYYGVMFPYGGAQPAHFAAARGGTVESALYSDEYGQYLAAMAPIRDSGGAITGVLEVYHNYNTVTENTQLFLGEMFYGILAVVSTVLVLLTIIDILIFLSLGYLRDASHQLMGGELGIKVKTRRRDEIGDLATDFNTMSTRLKEFFTRLTEVRDANARFVPQAFLDFLQKEELSQVHSGDQVKADMTVFFCDIRGFTSLSEGMTPKENFDFVNEYFNVMGPVIRAHNGFIDRYIGDAIQALFPGRPQDAVEAGLDMREALKEFNRHRVEQGKVEINFGVGVHREELILGVVGEPKRLSVTVISPAVDLVNKLEAETKHHKIGMVFTEEVYATLEPSLQERAKQLGGFEDGDDTYQLWGM